MEKDQLSSYVESTFQQRLAKFFAFLLPAAAMLQLPGITFFAHFWNVHFFSTGSITFLALGAICCFPARLKQLCRTLPRWLVGAFGILIAISLWQIFRHWNHYLLADMGFTLMYAVLPLFGMVFRKELIRDLPMQMTAFWGLNFIANLLQIYYYKTLPFGIPSNINWNAAWILFSGAGTVYWIYSALKKQKVMAGCLTALISAISFWLIFQCSCRALIPGLTGAVILALLIYLPSAKWKRAVGIMILASLAVGAVAFYKYAQNPETRKKILVDDRVFLAVTTPDMIMAAPMFGHGTPSFEQQFLPYYRQDAFFFLKHAPDRIDHPHNDILFVAAGYGLLGLLCIYGIIFYAIYTAYRNYHNEKENYAKILLFCFTILLIHAQVDLVFFHLPTAFFALILPGILLGTGKDSGQDLPAVPFAPVWQWGGALILCLGFTVAALELYSSHMLWKARKVRMEHGDNHPDVWNCYERAYQTPQASPFTLFSVVSDYLWGNGRRPADFLKVCEKLDRTAIPDYAHINCPRGIAHEQLGDLKSAEKYYIREAELYPLHVIPYMRLLYFYQKTRNVHNFRVVEKMLEEIMKKRALTLVDLEIIRQYPGYDTRPWEIPAELRAKVQKEMIARENKGKK